MNFHTSICLTSIQFTLPTLLYLLVTHGGMYLECPGSDENEDLCNSVYLTEDQ